MGSDMEIAQQVALRPIDDIVHAWGLRPEEVEHYGRYKAKIDLTVLNRIADRPSGKYIVVTAITPTPLGEGKTVTTIGLAQALQKIEKRAIPVIRQPSLGPVFGIKGGATGGGRAQVVPMEEINLHFTGDFHAVSAAHNLLAAMTDAHVFHGNTRSIDPARIVWPRVLDVLDRSLRHIVTGLGDKWVREASFEITAASEVMAILALASGMEDLRMRLGRIVIGYTSEKKPVTAEMLSAAGAMTALLKEAIKPNLVQTLEGGPALIHAGPFGNIAHGCSSLLADRLALRLADFVVTEAGFGADLGFEKFCHIKCRASDRVPDAAVLVCTVRSLKAHSGQFRLTPGKPLDPGLSQESLEALRTGSANLVKQIENVRLFGVPVVVAINRFETDTDRELAMVREIALDTGADGAEICEVWTKGGVGGVALAETVVRATQRPGRFRRLYDDDDPTEKKIETLAHRVYGAAGVSFSPSARDRIGQYRRLGFGHLPVCMAKTQYSLSHDPTLHGVPSGFTLPVQDVRLSAGAGFLYVLCGDIMTMPGLSSQPAAMRIDVNERQRITGLS
ncbi:MAG: formate--tetrahydrofolate ligase [candidate division Zixibacteria bacterium]|nr:formate--tetrahydrofolate ligase [candidate division Zixibacteria bacterium]